MSVNKIELIIFTQSTTVVGLVSSLLGLHRCDLLICLSTHELFEVEKKIITSAIKNTIVFHSFADFLTDAEMEYCDQFADRMIANKYKHRSIELLSEYYSQIKLLKNYIVKQNVMKMYKYDKCHLLNSDLGVDKHIWMGVGVNPLKSL